MSNTFWLAASNTLLKPNDHCYVSPPWDCRDGQPYLIARIMEFIEPTPAVSTASTNKSPELSLQENADLEPPAPSIIPSSSSSSSGSKPQNPTRVRVAYFLRPRDIAKRQNQADRLLIATMHSDICPTSYIRGICRVLHRDFISNVDEYKRTPDSFYFYQLYDRYLQRFFDIVPTIKVKNGPANVIQHLAQNFTFVFTEAGRAELLLEYARCCSGCMEFAKQHHCVSCVLCKRIYHLGCLDPPLARKPAAGYSWACTNCSKTYGDGLQKAIGSNSNSNTSNGNSKGKGKAIETPTLLCDGNPSDLILTAGWPFRYYGEHSDPSKVINPHDSLYPPAQPRKGYQATLPDPPSASSGLPSLTNKAKSGKGKSVRRSSFTRGEDDAVELLYDGSNETNDRMPDATELQALLPSSRFSTSLSSQAMKLAMSGSYSRSEILIQLKHSLEKSESRRFMDNDYHHWSRATIDAFEMAVRIYGDDIGEISKRVPGKSLGEVTLYWYIHKGHQYQLDSEHQIEAQVSAASKENLNSGGNHQAFGSDDAKSSRGSPPPGKWAAQCLICDTKSTQRWYRCPDHIAHDQRPWLHSSNRWVCEECGIRWRHYALEHPPTVDEGKTRKKKGSKEKDNSPPPQALLPPPPAPKPTITSKPCLLCKRQDPKSTLFQCSRCTLAGHVGCYGIPPEQDKENWLCDLCSEAEDPKTYRVPRCVLCPDIPPPLKAKKDVLTANDCLKSTEEHRHVHLTCSIWHQEVTFRQPEVLSVAEGCMMVRKRGITCFICERKDEGACVKCEDCNRHFHVSCAWTAGYRFVFQSKPLKRKKTANSVIFKNQEGVLSPAIFCKDHTWPIKGRHIYDIGEKDPLTKMTTIQIYVQNYKEANPRGDTFPLLRQARRHDSTIQPALQLSGKRKLSPKTGTSEEPMVSEVEVPEVEKSSKTKRRPAAWPPQKTSNPKPKKERLPKAKAQSAKTPTIQPPLSGPSSLTKKKKAGGAIKSRAKGKTKSKIVVEKPSLDPKPEPDYPSSPIPPRFSACPGFTPSFSPIGSPRPSEMNDYFPSGAGGYHASAPLPPSSSASAHGVRPDSAIQPMTYEPYHPNPHGPPVHFFETRSSPTTITSFSTSKFLPIVSPSFTESCPQIPSPVHDTEFEERLPTRMRFAMPQFRQSNRETRISDGTTYPYSSGRPIDTQRYLNYGGVGSRNPEPRERGQDSHGKRLRQEEDEEIPGNNPNGKRRKTNGDNTSVRRDPDGRVISMGGGTDWPVRNTRNEWKSRMPMPTGMLDTSKSEDFDYCPACSELTPNPLLPGHHFDPTPSFKKTDSV